MFENELKTRGFLFENPIQITASTVQRQFEITYPEYLSKVRQGRTLDLNNAHIESIEWYAKIQKGTNSDTRFNEIQFLKIKLSKLEYHSDLYRIATEIFRTINYQCVLVFEYLFKNGNYKKICTGLITPGVHNNNENIIQEIKLSHWIENSTPIKPFLDSFETFIQGNEASDIYKNIHNYINNNYLCKGHVTWSTIDNIYNYIFSEDPNYFKSLQDSGNDLKKSSIENMIHFLYFTHNDRKIYNVKTGDVKQLYEIETVWNELYSIGSATRTFLDNNKITTFDDLILKMLQWSYPLGCPTNTDVTQIYSKKIDDYYTNKDFCDFNQNDFQNMMSDA